MEIGQRDLQSPISNLESRAAGHSLISNLSPALFVTCLLLFLGLGAYQLSLPGLQYDEVKEAGLNAMQLVSGQPVSAFRDAVLSVGSLRIPLMVQDYIGSLNVLLAVPFLALGGVNAEALRWLPLLTGAVTLWLAWRLALRLGGPAAAAATALLLAVSPTFVFWSRQGIFVTNLTGLCFLAALLAGLRWWQEGKRADLYLFALFCGLGMYAKLLFAWAILAMLAVAALAWLLTRSARRLPPLRGAYPSAFPRCAGLILRPSPAARGLSFFIAALCFLLPLVPLVIFNLRTNGTLIEVFGNLRHSYYGVDNSAYGPNLLARVGQVRALLRGDHLWYLGESYANDLAAWIAGGVVLLAVVVRLVQRKEARTLLLPVLLLALVVAQSAFTVSDLFVTHFALALPLIPLAGGLAVGALLEARPFRPRAANVMFSGAALLALLGWAGSDGVNVVRYHQILTTSGGYGSHSDAVYRLSDYLEQRAPAAPLALDWGIDAQIRFLSQGRVNPIEVFGYDSLDAPDAGFAARVAPFLDDPNTLYVAHVPDASTFHGRDKALADLAAARGLALRAEATFGLRSGGSLFVVYRVVKAAP